MIAVERRGHAIFIMIASFFGFLCAKADTGEKMWESQSEINTLDEVRRRGYRSENIPSNDLHLCRSKR